MEVDNNYILKGKKIKIINHGSGCNYSASITASLARKKSIYEATVTAKEYVYQSFSAAGKRIEREMEDPDNEITIADCNEIHLIYSELKSNDEHE